jgi:hypothetical protein
MAFQMRLWTSDKSKLVELERNPLDEEERLEEWIARDPALLGMEVLIIGRQVHTSGGGRIDLLGIDLQGDIVIIELKRDKTPREVVAQVLDYGSWVTDLQAKDITDLAHEYLGMELSVSFKERFETDLPEAINNDHRMVIVASELDDSSERIVQYLSSRHSLNINVVFFTCFKRGKEELIGRAWLLDPEVVEERSEGRRKTAWSGYWFVNVGDGDHRDWDDCRKYGFLAAGYGSQYSDPLKKLKLGSKVFAYLRGEGYVGFGEVTQEAMMAKNFFPHGSKTRLFDLPLKQDGIKHHSKDAEMADYVVGIRWRKAFPREQPKRFTGAFANQNVVCKLRDQRTIEFLKREFQVQD